MLRLAQLFLVFCVGLLLAPAAWAAVPPSALPPRPTPFRFVNDQAQLMSEGDAKTLEQGLRRYADNTGTQLVVVTVPSLGQHEVGDYARSLGQAWGVGQEARDNGVVVLVAAQDHKVSIQPGTGLEAALPPSLTARVISQQFGPAFKQGRYFAGLRTGLSVLMKAANPDFTPGGSAAATTTTPAATAPASEPLAQNTTPESAPMSPAYPATPAEEPSSGMGMLPLLLLGGGAVLLFLFLRRRRQASTPPSAGGWSPGPGGGPAQPTRPTPDFGATGSGYGTAGPGYSNAGPGGYNNSGRSSGSGLGTVAAAAAAAGAAAYIGSRMGDHGHDTSHDSNNYNSAGFGGAGTGAGLAGAAGTGAADDFFNSRNGGAAEESTPDYFTPDDSPNDFFPSDNSSYDDPNSGDSGGDFGSDDSGSSGSW